jgi:hypothetical protein
VPLQHLADSSERRGKERPLVLYERDELAELTRGCRTAKGNRDLRVCRSDRRNSERDEGEKSGHPGMISKRDEDA